MIEDLQVDWWKSVQGIGCSKCGKGEKCISREGGHVKEVLVF